MRSVDVWPMSLPFVHQGGTCSHNKAVRTKEEMEITGVFPNIFSNRLGTSLAISRYKVQQ